MKALLLKLSSDLFGVIWVVAVCALLTVSSAERDDLRARLTHLEHMHAETVVTPPVPEHTNNKPKVK